MSIVGVLFSLAMLLAVYPTTLHRFTELTSNLSVIRKDTLKDYQEFNGLNLRLYFWKTSVTQLYEDNRLVTGVGTGDGQDYLDQAYIKRHLNDYGYLGFDPHNQWIITLLQLGLIGVALLGSFFLFGLWRASKSDNLPFIFFAWVMLCFSLSESVLEANKGVVFFALFFCVLCNPGKSKVIEST
jgi:O-antigen ligase